MLKLYTLVYAFVFFTRKKNQFSSVLHDMEKMINLVNSLQHHFKESIYRYNQTP